jgi:hypothetical protein
MKIFDLLENEKRILRALNLSGYREGMFSDLSREELNVAFNNLKEYGLINAIYASSIGGGILAGADVSERGKVYLKENPTLENPASDNYLKKLQINDLEYKKKFRKQENIIRYWKLSNAITGLLALVGWLLYLIAKNIISFL